MNVHADAKVNKEINERKDQMGKTYPVNNKIIGCLLIGEPSQRE